MDDGELWETHLNLKSQLIEFVRRRAVAQAERRGESPLELQRLERVLSPDALTIGFARRFATYKRANLILTDIERLASMVNDPNRPVQFVFAGKAHPLDEPGKRVLQQIAELMRDSKFRDKFVFVEDYDINVGRHFVQGVDVWLNNPRPSAGGLRNERTEGGAERRPESLDPGWVVGGSLRWHEWLRHRNGQDTLEYERSRCARRRRPAAALREEVIPLYYQRDRDGLPRGWIKRMKRTIRTLGWRFNADRMVMDYTQRCYLPAAGGTSSDLRSN